MDDIIDEERDRERDEYERQLEQDEDRARRTERRKRRDAMSRRVTGAEQSTSTSILGVKRLLPAESEVGGTPPKQPQSATVSSRAHIARGAGRHEEGARYRGTEPSAAGRDGPETQRQRPASNGAQAPRERQRLFTDLDTVADIFRGASEEVEPEEIGGLIAAMNPQQLAASLEHMALMWREIKGGDTEGMRACRPSASDSQLQRPTARTYTGATRTSPRRTQRRSTEAVRECDEDPPCNIERADAGPVRDIPLPTTARRATTPDEPVEEATSIVAPGDNDKARKPAANRLETYAGQGASVESFIAKFESHAKYYKWSEQDRVFQLKNSLTGTAAQALWTGG